MIRSAYDTNEWTRLCYKNLCPRLSGVPADAVQVVNIPVI